MSFMERNVALDKAHPSSRGTLHLAEVRKVGWNVFISGNHMHVTRKKIKSNYRLRKGKEALEKHSLLDILIHGPVT
ncbi:hypothetical protein ALC56_12375 [Trachymyrmex septentrionalis]|uniref:Uncharacterized protein n=1 Tax=Trachymyrmex septentrionalis TaxID=34720 RepID=A0A195EYM1_9HYME|nr:hypothetical protein ALC56_12375 [Trachymyrmex septentrionalis]